MKNHSIQQIIDIIQRTLFEQHIEIPQLAVLEQVVAITLRHGQRDPISHDAFLEILEIEDRYRLRAEAVRQSRESLIRRVRELVEAYVSEGSSVNLRMSPVIVALNEYDKHAKEKVQ